MSVQKRGREGGIFPRRSVEADVERELRAHLDLRVEDLVREGWDPVAARQDGPSAPVD